VLQKKKKKKKKQIPPLMYMVTTPYLGHLSILNLGHNFTFGAMLNV
jgi:hypothetical protein